MASLYKNWLIKQSSKKLSDSFVYFVEDLVKLSYFSQKLAKIKTSFCQCLYNYYTIYYNNKVVSISIVCLINQKLAKARGVF